MDDVIYFSHDVNDFAERLKAPFPKVRVCLSELNLVDNDIEIIARAIGCSYSLKYLFIVKCQITCHEVKILLKGLKRNRSIILLDLWNNEIADEGAALIADWLKENKHLKTLNLSSNWLTKAGLQRIADSLTQNVILTHLYLQHEFPPEHKVAEIFLKPMKYNRSLQTLKLSFSENTLYDEFDEDRMLLDTFLEENYVSAKQVCEKLLCYHDLRFGFNRQRLILFGAVDSGKSLLWRNLTSCSPPKNIDSEGFKKDTGVRFHVATSLTDNPFLEEIVESESFINKKGDEVFKHPDMVMDAAIRLGNKLVKLESSKQRRTTRRDYSIQRRSRYKSSQSVSSSKKPSWSRGGVKYSSPSVRSSFISIPTENANMENTGPPSLSLEFNKRKVRNVEHEKLSLSFKKSKSSSRSTKRHLNFYDHKNGIRKQTRRASKKTYRRFDAKKELEGVITVKNHVDERNPLNSQTSFTHNHYYNRKGFLKYLSYSCLEFSGQPCNESFAKLVLPDCEYGLYLLCFNLQDVQKYSFGNRNRMNSIDMLKYWLKYLFSLYLEHTIVEYAEHRIILIGTHLDLYYDDEAIQNKVLNDASNIIKRLKQDLEREYLGVSTGLLVDNMGSSTPMFFPVSNKTGEGIQQVYSAITRASKENEFVRKSISLMEYTAMDHIRPQALLKKDNNYPPVSRENEIYKLCHQLGIQEKRYDGLLRLFSGGSGLGYWFEEKRIVFNDVRYIERLYNLVLFGKFDFLSCKKEINMETLELFEDFSNKNSDKSENERIAFSLLRWPSSGRYFIELIRQCLLVCTIPIAYVPYTSRNHILRTQHEFEEEFGDESSSSDSDTESSCSSSEGQKIDDEYLLIPKFLKPGPSKSFVGEQCLFKITNIAYFEYRSVYQSLLNVVLPLLAKFDIVEVILHSNYSCMNFKAFNLSILLEGGLKVFVDVTDNLVLPFLAHLFGILLERVISAIFINGSVESFVLSGKKYISEAEAKQIKLTPWFQPSNPTAEKELNDLFSQAEMPQAQAFKSCYDKLFVIGAEKI